MITKKDYTIKQQTIILFSLAASHSLSLRSLKQQLKTRSLSLSLSYMWAKSSKKQCREIIAFHNFPFCWCVYKFFFFLFLFLARSYGVYLFSKQKRNEREREIIFFPSQFPYIIIPTQREIHISSISPRSLFLLSIHIHVHSLARWHCKSDKLGKKVSKRKLKYNNNFRGALSV